MKVRDLILIGCLFAVGCKYDFSSDNFIDIEESSFKNIIVLNDFNNLDTINNLSQLKYSLNGKSNQKLIEAKIFLDNKEISSSWQDNIGTFIIYPPSLNDGIHNIRIEAIYNSGTRSIADQVGLESIKETVEFQFVVHLRPSIPPAITEAVINNGSITVRWSPIENPEYVNAYLRIKFKVNETLIPLTPEMLFQCEYIDTSTVIYELNSNTPNYDYYSTVNYSIVFENNYTKLEGVEKSISCDSKWFDLKVSYVDLNSYKVKWSRHPLYANFDSYEISSGSINIQGSNEGGEYLISSPYLFGGKYSGSIRPISTRRYFDTYYVYEMELDSTTFGLLDFNHLFIKDLEYNSNTDQYYALVVESKNASNYVLYIYQYSSDFKFIKKTRIVETVGVRFDSVELFFDPINNKFYLDTSDSSYILDPNSLSILKSYTDTGCNKSRTIRGNILKSWNSDQQTIALYNIESNTLIYSGNSVNQGHLSLNGKYACINSGSITSVYTISNNQLEKIMDISVPLYQIHIVDDLLFYISNRTTVCIVNLINNDVKSFLFGLDQQTLQYDSYSKKLIASQNGSHKIYDLNTEQISPLSSLFYKSHPGEFHDDDDQYYLWIVNGKLVHSKGISVDIQ